VHAAVDRRGGPAAVVGAEQQERREEELPVVHRGHVEQRKVERASGQAVEVGDLGPVVALIFRIPQHALRCLHQRVHVGRVGGTDREGDAPEQARRESLLEALPGQPAVRRAVDPARGSARDELPGTAHKLPQAGKQHARIARHHHEVGGAGRVVHEQHLLPRLAAVRGAEYAALRIRRPDVTERGHEHDIGVGGVDHDAADLADVPEAHGLPGLAAVGRHEHATPVHDVVPRIAFARAHPHHVRVRRCKRDGADGRRGLILEDRVPGIPAVHRLPHSACRRADVIHVAVARHTDDRRDPPAADRRTEVTKLDVVERVAGGRDGGRWRHGGRLIFRSLVATLAREWCGNDDGKQCGADTKHDRLLQGTGCVDEVDLSGGFRPVKHAPRPPGGQGDGGS